MPKASLRALLSGVIDYAGLFPPAKLPLDQAIRNFARYHGEAEGWMLGRFVCPAARLAELAPFHDELFRGRGPFAFAALGRGGANEDAFLHGLRDDLHAIADFHERHGPAVEVDVLEMRLPPDVLGAEREGDAVRLLAESAHIIDALGPPALRPIYEAPLREGWQTDEDEILEALDEDAAAAADEPRTRCLQAGFKLRCGGLEASAFPPAEQVAWTILAAEDRELPMKFTAGLHHPLRRFDAEMQTPMHGFLNVLLAGVFAELDDVDDEVIVPLLLNEEPAKFVFEDDGVRWQDLRVDLAGIEKARREAVLSFGSCSFDEPRDDLRALGLL